MSMVFLVGNSACRRPSGLVQLDEDDVLFLGDPTAHIDSHDFTGQMMLAKALYDNVAETGEELAFRRGEVLVVLEKDTQGLDGWWLCSLRGKRGIVPGNRVKELAGMAPADHNVYAVPPSQNKQNRKSWHDPNKIVTPRKQGDQYVYEEPKSLIHHVTSHAQEGGQDYDVPRSHLSNQSCPIYDEPQFRNDNVTRGDDVMRESKPLPALPAATTSSQHVYAVPSEGRTSNRSSVASMFSTGSNSQSAGGESRASSLEIPGQEVYDVPPPPKFVTAPHNLLHKSPPPPPQAHVHAGNRGSEEATYDRPRNTKEFSPDRDYMEINEMPTKNTSKDFQSKYIEDYDVPKSDTSRSSGDSGIDTSKLEHLCDIDTEDVYDTPRKSMQAHDVTNANNASRPNSNDVYSTPRSSKVHDIYDSPKALNTSSSASQIAGESVYSIPTNNSPAPPPLTGGATDTPPKMHTINSTGFASSKSPRVDSGSLYDVPSSARNSDSRMSTTSTCSGGSDIGPVPYDTIDIDLDSAITRLNALIQECQRVSTKLLSYVKLGWRRAEVIEPRIPVLRETSAHVHRTMRQFVELAQGALANSVRIEDKSLARKLCKQLAPVEESAREVGKCLGNLEVGSGWELARLVHHGNHEKGDDLDIIVHRTREFPVAVNALASLIKGNATLLFPGVLPITAPPGGETPLNNISSRNSTPGDVAKPKRPPPPVKPKPKLTLDKKVPLEPGRRSGVQERPLPTLPQPQDAGGLYDVPRSSLIDANRADGGEYDYDYVALSRENSTVENTTNNQIKNTTHIINNTTDGSEYKSPRSVMEQHREGRALSKTPEPLSVPPNPGMLELPPAALVVEDEGDYDVPSSNKPLITAEELQAPHIRTSGLSPKFREKLEQLQVEAQATTVVTHSEQEGNYDLPQQLPPRHHQPQHVISDRDRQILGFYAEQMMTHVSVLLNASDAFFLCCEEGQPPKVFIAHSKFVILAAHKLVYIADTITRSVASEDVRLKVMTCANRLCDALKLTVTATKAAALNFPQVMCVQDMVDRVVEVTQAAHALKAEINRPFKS